MLWFLQPIQVSVKQYIPNDIHYAPHSHALVPCWPVPSGRPAWLDSLVVRGQPTNKPRTQSAYYYIYLYVCWAELCPLRLLRKLNAFIWPPPQQWLLLHLLPLSYNCESLLRVFQKKIQLATCNCTKQKCGIKNHFTILHCNGNKALANFLPRLNHIQIQAHTASCSPAAPFTTVRRLSFCCRY